MRYTLHKPELSAYHFDIDEDQAEIVQHGECGLSSKPELAALFVGRRATVNAATARTIYATLLQCGYVKWTEP